MDPWVRDQVGLEFCHVNIQGTIKSQRCCDGRDDLCNESVQVGVGRTGDFELFLTDVINGLIVHKKSYITMLKGSMSKKERVVWLYNGG